MAVLCNCALIHKEADNFFFYGIMKVIVGQCSVQSGLSLTEKEEERIIFFFTDCDHDLLSIILKELKPVK